MRWVKRVVWWLRGRLYGDRVRWNVDEDIRTHIELDAERLRGEGMDPAAALAEARRRFGDADALRREMLHEAATSDQPSGGPALGRLWTHLRHATRSLRSTPGPTMLVAGALGAAVGVTTLTITLSRTVLSGAGGVADADQVVSLHAYYPQLAEGLREQPLHASFLADLRQVDGVATLAAFRSEYFNLTGHGDPVRLDGLSATPELFRVAGVHPLFGPGFDGLSSGDEKVAVISWHLWKDVLGADPQALGSSLVLNDEPYEVVGVMPAGFSFPRAEDVPPTFRFPERPEVWVPFVPPLRGPSDLGVVARLTPGTTVEALRPRLDAALSAMAERVGRGDPGFSFQAVGLRQQAVGRIRPALLMLLLSTGLLMAVAMANVTGVGVARSEARVRELAVRTALGAGRGGVAAYLAAESFVLTLVTTLLALGVADVLAAVVRALAPEGIPGIDQVRVGPGTAGLAFALAGLASSFLAVGPLLRMRRLRIGEALRGTRSTGSRGTRRAGSAVVALELAATLVLVMAASVLTRSVLHLLAVDPGFDPQRVMTAEITLPEARYPEVARAAAVQRATWPMPESAVPRFQRSVVQALEARPGIEAAAFAKPLPFSGGQEASVFWADGMEADEPPITEYTVVTEDYFRAMGIPVLEGREFASSETHDSEPVAIVSQSLAAMFPGGHALGERIKLGGSPEAPYPWLRVIGVVGDVKRTGLTGPGRPEFYVHVSQGGYTNQSTSRLVVRAAAAMDPRATLGAIRAVVREEDPSLAVDAPRPMAELVAGAAARSRFSAALTVGFSVLALLITALGLYSVISFGAASRRRELALRTAMGASGARIAGSVLRETLKAAAWGTLLGLAGTVVAAGALRSLVFGVRPLEPVSLLVALVALGIVVVLAAQGPVRACLKLDPARILSEE